MQITIDAINYDPGIEVEIDRFTHNVTIFIDDMQIQLSKKYADHLEDQLEQVVRLSDKTLSAMEEHIEELEEEVERLTDLLKGANLL